jgi:hypothetical protein
VQLSTELRTIVLNTMAAEDSSIVVMDSALDPFFRNNDLVEVLLPDGNWVQAVITNIGNGHCQMRTTNPTPYGQDITTSNPACVRHHSDEAEDMAEAELMTVQQAPPPPMNILALLSSGIVPTFDQVADMGVTYYGDAIGNAEAFKGFVIENLMFFRDKKNFENLLTNKSIKTQTEKTKRDNMLLPSSQNFKTKARCEAILTARLGPHSWDMGIICEAISNGSLPEESRDVIVDNLTELMKVSKNIGKIRQEIPILVAQQHAYDWTKNAMIILRAQAAAGFN